MSITLYGSQIKLDNLTCSENIDVYTDTKEYHPNQNKKIFVHREPDIICICYPVRPVVSDDPL